jgi:hypothetical protein
VSAWREAVESIASHFASPRTTGAKTSLMVTSLVVHCATSLRLAVFGSTCMAYVRQPALYDAVAANEQKSIGQVPTPSVALSLLLDPARGATAAHPFDVLSATDRAAVLVFRQSLDDTTLP